MDSIPKLLLLRVGQSVKICTKYTHTHPKYVHKYIMAQCSKNVFLSQIAILSGSRMEVEGRGHRYHKAIQ